ncbi:hypothetical protein VA7868_04628 [Vibrio aerogenes CECT 7868]|uniref:DUF4123 domain-containing protein n=1 Tax=Vibrio aerogenes CECT 7868 TaxID=1216006 RepID=A0A1M6FCT1_9VIBR|nr:DUF4123 domain-containing protein [Vibrio aerogenes]SHI95473.1 hypothetical protein VA7868_04628 [Vibrio aerogenes CECT 7868]
MMSRFNTQIPDIYAPDQQTLYLLVDGGQIKNIAQSLYQIPEVPPLEPVYIHAPHDELKDVSPYLVTATDDVKRWFWAQDNPTAGFFFSSSFSLTDIGDWFHQLIQVLSPYGSDVYLKMAHSEVAWVLLESQAWCFWHPMQKAWLPTRLGWKVLERPEMEEITHPFPYKLNDLQWEQFGQIMWRNLLESLDIFITEEFPHLKMQHDDFDLWLGQAANVAYQLGFTTECDQLHYFNVIGLLGERAVTAESPWPDIGTLIHQISEKTPAQRIETASQLAQHYSQTPAAQENQIL